MFLSLPNQLTANLNVRQFNDLPIQRSTNSKAHQFRILPRPRSIQSEIFSFSSRLKFFCRWLSWLQSKHFCLPLHFKRDGLVRVKGETFVGVGGEGGHRHRPATCLSSSLASLLLPLLLLLADFSSSSSSFRQFVLTQFDSDRTPDKKKRLISLLSLHLHQNN